MADNKAFAKAVAPRKTFIFALQKSVKHLSLLVAFRQTMFQIKPLLSAKTLAGIVMTHFRQTTLRQFYILILSFSFLTTFGQTSISWTNLAGNWQIVKEVNINKGDTSAPWKPDKSIIYSFDSNSKFIDKTSTANTVFAGNYNIDKVKKRISFSNIVQTTKFPGTANKDFVNPAPRPDIFVTKLTADTFVYYSKGCDEVDNSNCFSYTYLRKVK